MTARVHHDPPPGSNADALRSDAFRERLMLFGLCLPAILLVVLVMMLPVGWLLWLSFLDNDGGFTLEHYQRLIASKSYARVFVTTFQVSIVTTAVCVLIGYPLAYFLAQLPARIANMCLITVLLPFWTSLLVRTYAWLVLLQREGLINTWGIELGLWTEPLSLVHNMAGTLIGMIHVMLPFLVLPLYGSMRAIDTDYMKAAANCGARPSQAFWQVYLPLSLPGLFAGALIVFILCLGFFVTPAVLGGGKVVLVSMRIATNIELFFNWGASSALGVVLLVLTLGVLWISARILRMDRILGGVR